VFSEKETGDVFKQFTPFVRALIEAAKNADREGSVRGDIIDRIASGWDDVLEQIQHMMADYKTAAAQGRKELGTAQNILNGAIEARNTAGRERDALSQLKTDRPSIIYGAWYSVNLWNEEWQKIDRNGIWVDN
jgi:hypothetical protein